MKREGIPSALTKGFGQLAQEMFLNEMIVPLAVHGGNKQLRLGMERNLRSKTLISISCQKQKKSSLKTLVN